MSAKLSVARRRRSPDAALALDDGLLDAGWPDAEAADGRVMHRWTAGATFQVTLTPRRSAPQWRPSRWIGTEMSFNMMV